MSRAHPHDAAYDWPAQRGQELGTINRISEHPERQARAEQALAKLVSWGDGDIAIILGLLPDDGSVE